MQLLCTFLYKSFAGHKHTSILGFYPKVEFLGHTVGIYLVLDAAKWFLKMVALPTALQLSPHPHLYLSRVLI